MMRSRADREIVIKLHIETGEALSLQKDPALNPVQEWRGAAGTVIATAYAHATRRWLQMPGVAMYCFEDGSDVVVAVPEAGAQPELVQDAFLRAVLPLLLHTRGLEALHASAVCGPEGVAAFCAPALTGKSTLAYGLTRRGYAPFADDAVVLRQDADGWRAVPVPFRFRLRAAATTYFAADGEQSSDNSARAGKQAQPLGALFLPTRIPPAKAEAPVTVSRLAPAAALPLILSHAYYFNLEDRGRKQRMAAAYLDLATRIPAYDLRYADALGDLSTVLDAVERTISALPDPG